jgi:outer membrane cobalamin receptor
MNNGFHYQFLNKSVGVGLIFSIICGIVASSTVWAAETEIPVYEDEEVVITATRTKQEESKAPGRTEVISREEIEATGATTVAEVLQREGIVISSYGGASGSATVQLDGADAKQTLILVNGIPANTGCLGSVDLSYFPTAGVQKIEVAHGPLSALYGANALGGVVNIITDLTGEAQNQVTMSGGTNQYGRLEMVFQQEKFGIAFGGNYTDGHREHSATTNTFLMGQYDLIRKEDSTLTVNLLHRVKNNQEPGTSDTNGFEESFSMDINGKYTINDLVLETKIFGQSLDNQNNSSSKSRHQTKIYGIDAGAIYQLGQHQLLGGFMLKQDSFRSTKSGNHDQDNGAIYVQDLWNLSDHWVITSGLRWDTGTDFSSPVCPRIYFSYAVSENYSIKFGYGKSYKAPTIHDLYWPYYSDLWGTTVGNPNLRPETGERYEITSEWRNGGQAINVNCFTAKVIDGINWKQNNNVWTPTNIDKMQIYGSSLSWKSQWNQYISTGLKYTWTDRQAWSDTTQSYSIDENSFGKNHATINLGYQRGAWNSNLDWNWVTERKDDKADYAVLNYSIKYQVNEKLNYGLTIANLTDESYEVYTGYPMPGREYRLTANYTF